MPTTSGTLEGDTRLWQVQNLRPAWDAVGVQDKPEKLS